MMGFRQKYGFGRAIAAPQIGDAKRIIYLNTGDQIIEFVNPRLSFPEKKMLELWDDCMSFPGLEVKVVRYDTVNISYKDSNWEECEITFQGDLAELIQHEYDHLDGILAVQRAIDNKSFRMNSEKAGCY
jgi:peptide deformylase